MTRVHRLRGALLIATVILTIIPACSDETQAGSTLDSTTSLPSESTTTRDLGEEVDPCELLTIDEVKMVIEEPRPGQLTTLDAGNAECSWQTDTGGFQETELVVQVIDGGEGFAAVEVLESLREAMDVREEVDGLGDEAFAVDWADDGIALVIASGQHTVTVSIDAPVEEADLMDVSSLVLEALPGA